MPDQACASSLKLHDIQQELDSITPLEWQTCCQMHTILDYTTDEKIWRILQSQWTMCKCTDTIGPGTKNFTSNVQ